MSYFQLRMGCIEETFAHSQIPHRDVVIHHRLGALWRNGIPTYT